MLAHKRRGTGISIECVKIHDMSTAEGIFGLFEQEKMLSLRQRGLRPATYRNGMKWRKWIAVG